MMIDSNVLVYALTDASPKQKIAQNFLQSQKYITFAQQNIFEATRVLTHPKFSDPFSITEVKTAMEIIISQTKIIHPTSITLELAFQLLQKYQITGTEVFDAYLVATALSHGITQIATDNVKHLGKYQEIDVVNPF
jgi:predicted nucleic acid-binding protein